MKPRALLALTFFFVANAFAAPHPVTVDDLTRIFNVPRPSPHLWWSPDGSQLGFVALVNDLPQVVNLPSTRRSFCSSATTTV